MAKKGGNRLKRGGDKYNCSNVANILVITCLLGLSFSLSGYEIKTLTVSIHSCNNGVFMSDWVK